MAVYPTKDPFEWTTLKELIDNPPPEVHFIWGGKENGLLQEKSFAMLHASEKMGKSMFSLNLAVAGAREDAEFLGIPIRAGGFRTMILQCEVHMRAVYERFLEMLTKGALTDEQASAIVINGFRAVSLSNPFSLYWLRRKIRKFKPDILVIDPLARMLVTDENSNVAVGRELAPLLALRDDPGCAVIVVHHDTKVGEGNAGRPAHQRSRGANRLTADPDAIWSLSARKRAGGPTSTFSCTARYGRQMEPFRVRLNERTFWFERYSTESEHGEQLVAEIIGGGGDLDESSLIALLREKWNLHDEAHNDRTIRQRLDKAVADGIVRKYEVGTVTFYHADKEHE